MLSVFQVKQCPQLTAPAKYDTAAVTAVTTIRTAFWNKFFAMEMKAAGSAFPDRDWNLT